MALGTAPSLGWRSTKAGPQQEGLYSPVLQSYTESILRKVLMSNSMDQCLHEGTLTAPLTDPDLKLPEEGKVKIEWN